MNGLLVQINNIISLLWLDVVIEFTEELLFYDNTRDFELFLLEMKNNASFWLVYNKSVNIKFSAYDAFLE